MFHHPDPGIDAFLEIVSLKGLDRSQGFHLSFDTFPKFRQLERYNPVEGGDFRFKRKDLNEQTCDLFLRHRLLPC